MTAYSYISASMRKYMFCVAVEFKLVREREWLMPEHQFGNTPAILYIYIYPKSKHYVYHHFISSVLQEKENTSTHYDHEYIHTSKHPPKKKNPYLSATLLNYYEYIWVFRCWYFHCRQRIKIYAPHATQRYIEHPKKKHKSNTNSNRVDILCKRAIILFSYHFMQTNLATSNAIA